MQLRQAHAPAPFVPCVPRPSTRLGRRRVRQHEGTVRRRAARTDPRSRRGGVRESHPCSGGVLNPRFGGLPSCAGGLGTAE
ncbi:hypothetical protein CU044_2805 [Streptomyces sp. L-9-10]|nr:hypothetical protein CU044_2805 [Streptomyces sp. L-9-10]